MTKYLTETCLREGLILANGFKQELLHSVEDRIHSLRKMKLVLLCPDRLGAEYSKHWSSTHFGISLCIQPSTLDPGTMLPTYTSLISEASPEASLQTPPELCLLGSSKCGQVDSEHGCRSI